MSIIDSTQIPNGSDKIALQTAGDQTAATPLVDMSNPNVISSTFKSQDSATSVVSPSGQLMFSNPYETNSQSGWNKNNWQDNLSPGGASGGEGRHHRGGGHRSQSSDAASSGESSTAVPANSESATISGASSQTAAGMGSDAAAASAASQAAAGQVAAGASNDAPLTSTQIQQLQGQIAQLEQEASQLQQEIQTLGSTAVSTGVPMSDNSAVNTGTPGSDNSAVNTGTPGSDNSSANTGTPGSDNSSANTGTPGSDNSSANTGTPGSDNGGLYVQGNQLMDNGKPFVLAGINDSTATEHNELTGSMASLAADGANTIRIIGQASDMTGGANDAFNQEIQAALNAGLKVDIAYNTDTAIYGQTGGVMSSSDVAEAQQALSTEAAEWGSNSNVMFNVVNEQGASGDATNPQMLANTTALEQAVVQGAQSTDPNAKPVIVVDDSEWGQGGYDSNYQSQSFLYNNAAALEAAGNGNVVGAVHNYDSGSSYNNQGIEAIQNEGMPVIAEEIGYNPSSFNLSEQTSSATGEPIGGLVWVDGTDPNTGAFYNNIMNDSNLAPQVVNFWQTIDSEAASATPSA